MNTFQNRVCLLFEREVIPFLKNREMQQTLLGIYLQIMHDNDLCASEKVLLFHLCLLLLALQRSLNRAKKANYS